MERHYYISNDLDDLEEVEQQLEEAGISTPQIHVLSNDDAEVEGHHLNEVDPFTRKDVVHSTEIGAAFGLVGAATVLAAAYFSGVTETVGWVPFVFLAIVVLGFLTWEGGLFGIQVPNHKYRRFQADLHAGRHVLFVEVSPDQESALKATLQSHPKLKPAGDEHTPPEVAVAVGAQKTWRRFVNWAP